MSVQFVDEFTAMIILLNGIKSNWERNTSISYIYLVVSTVWLGKRVSVMEFDFTVSVVLGRYYRQNYLKTRYTRIET